MPIFRATDIQGDQKLTADIVVIGSGAGGAVAAHELARQGHSVVMLERGPYHVTSEFKSNPQWAFDNLYANHGVTAGLGIPPVLVPHGDCVGGTTVINSGTVFRTPRDVLDRWTHEFGVAELDAARLDPFFSYIEQKIGATESVWPALGEYNRVIERGVKKLGFKGGPLVRNAPNCNGCGMCVFGCPTGAKQSMLVTFVPAADNLGVKIFAECRVDQIRVKNGRAAGVHAEIVDRATGIRRGSVDVDARVVLVAAGTFATPGILADSNLGGRSGELGGNLWIHPAAGAAARMPEEVNAWRAIPQGYMVDEWHNQGILLEGGFGPPEVISLIIPGYGEAYQDRVADYSHLVSFGCMIQDRDSVGSVHYVKGMPPIIRYQLGKEDKNRMVFGWKKMLEIFFAAGATEVYPVIAGFPVLKSAVEIDSIQPEKVGREDLTLSAFHPMGTARMGGDPATSVIDSYGELHGTKGVFVADGSVFPSALGVNPQASIMAFAARTADYIHRNSDRYLR